MSKPVQNNDDPLQSLIRQLARLPGLGQRSARRIALHMLQHHSEVMTPLATSLQQAADTIVTCHECGNLDTCNPCHICRDTARDTSVICVVAGVADIWAIERTRQYRGTYHVLGGVLSALDGVGPQDLRLDALVTRAATGKIREIIMALAATVDGQTTAHVLQDMLSPHAQMTITRLAHGLPMGGELDYMDDGTIGLALAARTGV